MDVSRFTSINTARGAWSLIQDLGSTAAKAAAMHPMAEANRAAPMALASGTAGSHDDVAQPVHAGMGLEQVQQIVAQAAASVLGTDAEGGSHVQSPAVFCRHIVAGNIVQLLLCVPSSIGTLLRLCSQFADVMDSERGTSLM